MKWKHQTSSLLDLKSHMILQLQKKWKRKQTNLEVFVVKEQRDSNQETSSVSKLMLGHSEKETETCAVLVSNLLKPPRGPVLYSLRLPSPPTLGSLNTVWAFIPTNFQRVCFFLGGIYTTLEFFLTNTVSQGKLRGSLCSIFDCRHVMD